MMLELVVFKMNFTWAEYYYLNACLKNVQDHIYILALSLTHCLNLTFLQL